MGRPTNVVSSWRKQSEYQFVHRTGARIERRGYPEAPGWFLVSADPSQPAERFDPTPEGCDEAFIAFAGRRSAAEALTRMITKA